MRTAAHETKKANGAIVNDRRPPDLECWAFVVFTDSALSGWGKARGGRSLYALPVANPRQAETVLANGRGRSEMKRGRIVKDIRRVKLNPGDHLSIPDPADAAPWYRAGTWA